MYGISCNFLAIASKLSFASGVTSSGLPGVAPSIYVVCTASCKASAAPIAAPANAPSLIAFPINSGAKVFISSSQASFTKFELFHPKLLLLVQ